MLDIRVHQVGILLHKKRWAAWNRLNYQNNKLMNKKKMIAVKEPILFLKPINNLAFIEKKKIK